LHICGGTFQGLQGTPGYSGNKIFEGCGDFVGKSRLWGLMWTFAGCFEGRLRRNAGGKEGRREAADLEGKYKGLQAGILVHPAERMIDNI
jgi:hypothetical protein